MYTVGGGWHFISSPPGWWAIFADPQGKRWALPIVAWRILADNRIEAKDDDDLGRCQPYGEPIIHGGDGHLDSITQNGNYRPGEAVGGRRYDFVDLEFLFADYIPKTKGRLKPPVGDNMCWEVL